MLRIARVLIDSPLPQLDRLFDYLVPDALAAEATVGVRVKVPLRTLGRLVDGFVVSLAESVEEPVRPLSSIESVVSTAQVLTPDTFQLARRVADRAAGSAIDIIRLAVPKRQVRVEKAWLLEQQSTVEGAQHTDDPAAFACADATTTLSGFPGLAEALTAGERIALDAPAHTTQLPDGVTVGAWSVLIAAAAAATLANGRSAIIVVPDHRDEESVLAALGAVVPSERVVRADARQRGPERYRGFLRTLEAEPCVVVGNRSAVYAPVSAGLIAIWDDGDALLDEPLAPYVHARDAALIRQELQGGALLFAGHTRTSDVERLVGIGYLRVIEPLRRYSPAVVLPAAGEHEQPGVRIPSASFAALRRALAEGPVLVQVSRPGYAPVLVCAQCRNPARCAECGGPLHARARGAAAVCRWCGRAAHAWRCPTCSSDKLQLASSGSERTADELGRAFPGTRVIIADGEHSVLTVGSEPAVVVATRGAEPLAAGGYHAVLLLDGDRMLMAEALRIAEDCLRWWSNAAALAAPGAPVHLVGVRGTVAVALATWSQPVFALRQLRERAPLRLPPAVRVAALNGPPEAVSQAIAQLRAAVPGLRDDAVIGPVPVAEDGGAGVRALVRFDYGAGVAVAASLRGAVIAGALRGHRARTGPKRASLRVHMDVADPEL